ncbi:MAG: hypothetical protein BWK80_52755 [Desulfobacteraceae bacterium IS3]|nr:MAG: hypothetical protein BWK80_52755 [Desulfobacteraceae bacterium IS3]
MKRVALCLIWILVMGDSFRGGVSDLTPRPPSLRGQGSKGKTPISFQGRGWGRGLRKVSKQESLKKYKRN